MGRSQSSGLLLAAAAVVALASTAFLIASFAAGGSRLPSAWLVPPETSSAFSYPLKSSGEGPDRAAASPPPSTATASEAAEIDLLLPIAVPPSIVLPPAFAPAENFDDSVEESMRIELKLLPSDDQAVPTQSSASIAKVISPGQSTGSTHEVVPLWSIPADKELICSKREIQNAPVVSDDPELYGPLFRNVSVFKRSYELMERYLKIYVYKDGDKPIFHNPELRGIYASEGWFMKLLENNERFVVKDPRKAHLYYLPYSSRQLEHALYVPGTHSLDPLSVFIKNYIDMIATKYPFWNRTRGADHFLVACHDWGPYTTKLHKELNTNTIKALCNADTSEGVFIKGRDVSLPETYIRSAKRPLRDIGGKPTSSRDILAFFAGQMHGRVRPILLKHWRGDKGDMRIYEKLPRRISRRMSYMQHMKSSKYCICPMGYEVNSPRIVEAIYYECVPVIIADNFVLPFEDVLDWTAFSVVVDEKDIPALKDILLAIPPSQFLTMQMNVRRLQRHFLWHTNPVKYDLFHMILHSLWLRRVNSVHH